LMGALPLELPPLKNSLNFWKSRLK
jgi:hypothetical protein